MVLPQWTSGNWKTVEFVTHRSHHLSRPSFSCLLLVEIPWSLITITLCMKLQLSWPSLMSLYTLTKFQLNPTLHPVSASTYTVECDYMKPKPTQTGDTLNSKLQLKWAPDIMQRIKSLFQRAFTLLLFWNTNPFLLCPLQASVMTLFLFSMIVKNHWRRNSTFHIYHLLHLYSSILISSLITQICLCSYLKPPLTSALSPVSYGLLKNNDPANSTYPLCLSSILSVHFSFSTVLLPTYKGNKEQKGEAEKHRYLLMNTEIHKTQHGKQWTPNNTRHMIALPHLEILVSVQGLSPLESSFSLKVPTEQYQSILITLLTCCSSSTKIHVCCPSWDFKFPEVWECSSKEGMNEFLHIFLTVYKSEKTLPKICWEKSWFK